MSKKLTVKAIENLKPGASRQEIADGEGLYLCLQTSGKASFILRYRHAGRTRKLTLGGSAMGLGVARKKAAEARARIAAGEDPAGDKTAARQAQRDTVEAVVVEFVEKHVTPRLKPSTAAEYRRLLEKEIVARWRGRRLADISRRDVNQLLDNMVARAPISANRVLAILRKFCRWAVSRELIEHSPCDGVLARSAETPRDRVLDDRELSLVLRAAGELGFPYDGIVRLLILTGQRRGEVVGLRWSELDFDKRVWSLPPSRTKNKRPHVVPLSDAAIGTLTALPRFEGDFVFPTAEGSAPVSGHSRGKLRLDRAIAKIAAREGSAPLAQFGLHDLRRSWASGAAAIGIDLHVIERALNHTSGSFGGIVSVYQKHKFEDGVRRAMDAWGAHVERLASGAPTDDNVVRLAATQR
jgi:integrase